MKKEYNIELKTNFDEELEKQWLDLEKNSEITFFQTLSWQKYWDKNCGFNLSKIFALFYEDNILVCILPLNINKKFFIKYLNWNGFPFSDYNCPLVRKNFEFNSGHFELIINKIKKSSKFDFINLINNTNNSYLSGKFFKANNSYKLIFSKKESSVNIISKLQKKVKYEENRIQKSFKIVCDLKPDIETKKQIINFFMVEKKKQLDRSNAWNYLNIKKFSDYIANLNDFNSEFIDFSCLKINSKIVSSHIGYKFNRQFYYIFPVYDTAFKKYSVGNILLHKLIKNYDENNYELFDFTIGSELYKKKLNNNEIVLFDYLRHNNFIGIVCVNFLKIKYKLKRFLNTKKII